MSTSTFNVDDWDKLSDYLAAKASEVLSAGSELSNDIIYVSDVNPQAIEFAYRKAGDCDRSWACHTCQHFIQRYGNLVVVRNDKVVPVFWSRLDDKDSKETWYQTYKPAMDAIVDLFVNAKITPTHFVPEASRVGVKTSGPYNHFSFVVPQHILSKSKHLFHTSEGPILKEMLLRVLYDNSKDVITKAHDLLVNDRLPYADNSKAAVKWLFALRTELDQLASNKEAEVHNIRIIQAVHGAPTGFINTARSGLLSILLEGIRAGHDADTIKAMWVFKAGPTTYMRPTAAPSAGAIKTAERTFEELGLTKADLVRRFATHADVPESEYLWLSEKLKIERFKEKAKKEQESKGPGIFSHLPVKEHSSHLKATPLLSLTDKSVKMTMAKFVKEVLPQAKAIDYYVGRALNFYTFVTGNKDSALLMQWHNLVSWYTYPSDRSDPTNYNLTRNQWVTISSIVPFPHMWRRSTTTTEKKQETGTEQKDTVVDTLKEEKDKYSKHPVGYLFTIPGCYDVNHEKAGAGLFPTFMKSQFHEIRSVIESFSQHATIEGIDKAELSGLAIRPAQDALEGGTHTFAVTLQTGNKLMYVIDRND